MNRGSLRSASDSFRRYLAEIERHPLLSVDEEQRLARASAKGDARAAHELVTANLRFVVKLAFEYRSYGFGVSDLVQEGNLGLMRAVQKYDPDKGIRLISYAAWWIRAYIQNYILRSHSLVKLGTTQAQRKLFFSLARTKRELDRTSVEHGHDSDGEDVAKIAKKLNVKPREVEQMSRRMGGRDFSLDAPIGEDGGSTHVDFLPGAGPAQDHEISAAQEQSTLRRAVGAALDNLDARERFIVERRVMSDRPMTLKDLADHFGFSRERARQLELRAKAKLGDQLHAVADEVGWPTGGTPVDDADGRAAARPPEARVARGRAVPSGRPTAT